MTKTLRTLIAVLALMFCCFGAQAQFKEQAFSQNYDSSGETSEVGENQLFNSREFWNAIRGKGTTDMTNLFIGSSILVGGGQMYNKDYWKLPVLYTGIAGGIGGGLYFKNRYEKTGESRDKALMNGLFAAGALSYWGGLMDMTISFKSDQVHNPGKATVYSILLPGLGQMYNGEYWKLPIYYGLLIGSYTFYDRNATNYRRFRDIYNESQDPDVKYEGPIAGDVALYYRNMYRRYRDYSTLALVASYLLQVIDANVFAYMQDFEVSDDLSMHVGPAVLTPGNQYAFAPSAGAPAFGMKIGFSF